MVTDHMHLIQALPVFRDARELEEIGIRSASSPVHEPAEQSPGSTAR